MSSQIKSDGTELSQGALTSTPNFRGHISELDAVRGIGIVLVLSAHCWPTFWLQTTKMLYLAWLAMDSFFVLSGFLIVGILLDMRHKKDYFKAFYIRRSLRIFPVYYLVMAGTTAYVYLFRDRFAEMFSNWGGPWWFFAYLGNVPTAWYGKFPPGDGDLFNPLWSLQIEEQFYLLTPLFVRRMTVDSLKYLLWAAVVLSPLLRLAAYFQQPDNWLVSYVSLPFHVDGLALGALIAIRFRQGEWRIPRVRLSLMTAILIVVTVIICHP